MKILYAIQGTGNGHLSRAIEIIPHLQKAHSVDILISGIHSEMTLPFEVKYSFEGLGFVFGKNGGIDIVSTYKKNKIKTLFNEINSLPVEDYDLVINDFEPVSAWAAMQKNIPCVALSNQVAVLNKKSPKPKKVDLVGKLILKRYAPADAKYGFHFQSYDETIFTPIIRKQVRELETDNKGHITVYLPAYSDKKIIKVLSEFGLVQWEVFSKHSKEEIKEKNIHIRPIENEIFLESIANSAGVLCGAGFATPTEALFLGKKLMVIPMKGQYEQQCNAVALKQMGVKVIKKFGLKQKAKIADWLQDETIVKVDYPDITSTIIDKIIEDFQNHKFKDKKENSGSLTAEKLRKMLMKKISSFL